MRGYIASLLKRIGAFAVRLNAKPAGLESKPRVFLCDGSMLDFSGHCYNYLAPVEARLKLKGVDVTLVGSHHQDAQFHTETGALKAFSLWCDERNVGQANGLGERANADAIRKAHEAALVRDLRKLHQRFKFRHDDLIFINTLRHWALRGVPYFAARLRPSEMPRFSIVSLFSSEPELGVVTQSPRHYAEAFDAILKSPASNRIKVFTDADTLIKEYSDLSKLPVELVPFPQDTPPPVPRAQGGPIIIAYAGEARIHKGFHLLPYLVEKVGQRYTAGQVCFHIQDHISDPEQPFYRDSMLALKKAPNVKLFSGILTDQEYKDFLETASLLLLPYQTAHYHRQTSAVYNAAIAMDLPVVVTRGTWMSSKVEQFGGGALCNPDDEASLAEAVLTVCSRYAEFARAAIEAGAMWRTFNNTENFIKAIDWLPDA